MVGVSLANKLISLGHDVQMGARDANNEKASSWARQIGPQASNGTFASAAIWADVIVNCTAGVHSLAALGVAGAASMRGKVIIDIANPLDFSNGALPMLTVANNSSLGEQIQAAFPESRVIKTLNTMNHEIMVNPSKLQGNHLVFICGNDSQAKRFVIGLLVDFGWKPEQIMDLGDLTASRATEMYLPLWLRMFQALQTGDFNISISRP